MSVLIIQYNSFSTNFPEKANSFTSGSICRPRIGLHTLDRPGREPRCHRRLRSEAHSLGRHVQQGHRRQDSAQAETKFGNLKKIYL